MTLNWQGKRFVKDRDFSFLHVSMNYGAVMKRTIGAIEAADARSANMVVLILAELIAHDDTRNCAIAADIVAAARADRRILVLADRTDQVADLQRRVAEALERWGNPTQLFRIDSQLGVKARRATHVAIAAACLGSPGVCTFATGSRRCQRPDKRQTLWERTWSWLREIDACRGALSLNGRSRYYQRR